MPPRKTRPQAHTSPDGTGVPTWFRQWLSLRIQERDLGSRIKELHHRICGAIEGGGYADDKGSLFLDLDEPIEGFGTLKYERRVTKSFNEDRAEPLLTKKGLLDRCSSMVVKVTDQQKALALLVEHGLFVIGQSVETELDQEEILKCHYEDLIDQDELDSLFDVSESFAFKQVKA